MFGASILPRSARSIAACALAAWALGCTGQITTGPAPPPEALQFDEVELELDDGSLVPAELVFFANDRGESLISVLATPDTSGPWPAVVILHGSGGLFTTPDSNDTAYEVPGQFAEWAHLLTERGYAVLLPSSFASRGYWELHDSSPERLIMRLYDAYAALAYACARDDIRCDRIGALGFSNGGSTSLAMMHESVTAIDGMHELRPAGSFRISCAYYPGCGFHDLIEISDDDPDLFYRPTTDVWIHHGTDDGLLDGCEEREEQVEQLVELGEFPQSPFHMWVYDDVGHGFDGRPNGDTERTARDHARGRTLDLLAERLL